MRHIERIQETSMIRRRNWLAAAGAAAGRRRPARLGAGSFPSRPIRIVPFGTAGGPIDTLARVYADKLSARWGQPVMVDAKPGASGIIAADFVAKAAPDGHTVLFTLPLTHVNNAILQPKLPYDPVKDFQPLSMVATGGPMLVTRANAPYSNLKELVEFAKKKGRMTYGTWGNGSTAHLFGELLKRQTGTDLVHVAYKSEAAAHNDLFGEQLDFAWANPSTARNQSQAGKMKVLGIAATQRVSTCRTCRPSRSRASRASTSKAGSACTRRRRRPSPSCRPGSPRCAKPPRCPTCRRAWSPSASSRWATRRRSSWSAIAPTTRAWRN
jgi:tripartite-type tricarboxylate transporter receptor subunit TctC